MRDLLCFGQVLADQAINADIPRMCGVVEVMVCLFHFHNNQILTQIVRRKANRRISRPRALELVAFPSSKRTSPVILALIRSQPLSYESPARGAHLLRRAAGDRLPHSEALALTAQQIDLLGR